MINLRTMFGLTLALSLTISASASATNLSLESLDCEPPVIEVWDCFGDEEFEDLIIECTFLVEEETEKESNSKKEQLGTQTKKDGPDSVKLGIGPQLFDSVDRSVIVEDTLIYEDYVNYQPAPEDGAEEAEKGGKHGKSMVFSCPTKVTVLSQPHDLELTVPTLEEETTTDPIIQPAAVFPNPAASSDITSVRTGRTTPADVFVYDMSGKMVQTISEVSEKTELGRYTTGTYIILIKGEDGSTDHMKLLVR